MTPSGIQERLSTLRYKAEALAALKSDTHQKERLQQDMEILLHEIQVQQIGLEMQNAELLEGRRIMEINQARYENLYNKYANLFDLAPNAYVVFDEEQIIREANLTATILLNLPRKELVGRPMTAFIRLEDRDTLDSLLRDSRKSTAPIIGELNIVQDGGRRFPAQIQLQYLPRADVAGNEFRAAIMDLSEQMQASVALRILHQCIESAATATTVQNLLKAFIQHIKNYLQCNAVGIRLRDKTGNCPFQEHEGFDPQYCERENNLNRHKDQCVCIKVMDGQIDPNQPFFTPSGSFFINASSRVSAAPPTEALGRTLNGCYAEGFESMALIPIFSGRHISGLIHIADRRENKISLRQVEVLEQVALRLGLAIQRFYMQDKLHNALGRQRELAAHLLKAQEEEQRRIALELHDQTGQNLNVLKLRLNELQNKLGKDQADLYRLCNDTQNFIDTIIDDIRRISRGLNPSVLEALGLVPALKHMIREYSVYEGMHIEADFEALDIIDDRNIQTALFRMIQESVTNVFKHADASRMAIKGSRIDSSLSITIEDNGKGFAMGAESWPQDRTHGMGLAAMELRSRMIGARLTVHSEPQAGTRITITLPIENDEEIA